MIFTQLKSKLVCIICLGLLCVFNDLQPFVLQIFILSLLILNFRLGDFAFRRSFASFQPTHLVYHLFLWWVLDKFLEINLLLRLGMWMMDLLIFRLNQGVTKRYLSDGGDFGKNHRQRLVSRK